MSEVTNIVALSGGKDSTAMALRLAEIEPRDYVYVCTPTGDELPEMHEHWSRLESYLDSPIIKLSAGLSLVELCEKEKMLPNWRARFCTLQLKIKPMQRFIDDIDGDVILHVGLRADESGREGGIYRNAIVDFPMRRWGWGIPDVLGYLANHGIEIAQRTDCARCFFQTLPEWWALYKNHPEIFAHAEAQEKAIGYTFRSPSRDTWPASLADLRREFDSGRVPRGVEFQGDLFEGVRANTCRACTL